MLRIASIVLALFWSVSLFAEDWPHWRGLNRNDHVAEPSGWTGKQWPLSEAWKVNVGEGSTTPIVVGTNLFTMGWKENRETVVCLDVKTGQTKWKKSYNAPRFGRHAEGDQSLYFGPTSSPEYDQQHNLVYTLGCDGDLIAWRGESGEIVWQKNLYDEYKMPKRPGNDERHRNRRDYGYTTAPLVYKNWLIVEVGGPEGTVRAFNKLTGKSVWASEHAGFAGHSGSPVVMEVEGAACLVDFAQFELVVMRLDKGHEGITIATFPWESAYANNILTPTVVGNRVLISSWHAHEEKSNPATCLLEISLSGAKELWQKKVGSHICSPVVHDGRIYIAGPKLYCLDWETGETIWEGGGFDYGASIVHTADEKLILLGNRGELILAETATRSPKKYTEFARRKTLSGKDLWSHVILSNERIYVKDVSGNVMCLRVGE